MKQQPAPWEPDPEADFWLAAAHMVLDLAMVFFAGALIARAFGVSPWELGMAGMFIRLAVPMARRKP
jgi:hypothetical protein